MKNTHNQINRADIISRLFWFCFLLFSEKKTLFVWRSLSTLCLKAIQNEFNQYKHIKIEYWFIKLSSHSVINDFKCETIIKSRERWNWIRPWMSRWALSIRRRWTGYGKQIFISIFNWFYLVYCRQRRQYLVENRNW